MRLHRLLLKVRSSLWLVPVLCVLAGAALSFATIAFDRWRDYEAVPQHLVGGPAAATAILSTVAASMVSLTALVLTVTMVVVQLAMGQFSPRIVQRVLRDKPSQLAIGLFVATFVHAILALREVTDNGDGTGNVPGVAVITAFVLVLASIAVLVVYVHHIGQALRVSALIELVGKRTRRLLDREYPEPAAPLGPADDSALVPGARSGVVTAIGHEVLVAAAREADCVLELLPALGEFVPAGAPLFRVHGDPGRIDADELQRALVFDLEPTLDHDVAYGFRLLVDIAERSLADSPLQDPTTAVQSIDRLHDLLRRLVGRPFPSGEHRDEEGVVRLRVPVPEWEDYVDLAFHEIRLAAAGSPPVTRRLELALRDLRAVAPPERVGVLDLHLDLLARTTEAALSDERDVAFALSGDRAGIGVAAGDGRR
jgi:uncharacterized membrane protein